MGQTSGPATADSSRDSGTFPAAQAAEQSGALGTPSYATAVTDGAATAETLPLSLLDAISRGLRNNLSRLSTAQISEEARAERLRALSKLLPNVSARSTVNREKVNLAVFGFPLPPGTPPVVGPFDIVDNRAAFSGSIFDFNALNKYRASFEDARAAGFARLQARELIVLVVGNAYLLSLADAARVETLQAQFKTAETLFNRAVDMKKAGVIPGIDLLRSQVQMQAQQQRVLAARNDLEKQKLALARAIGLPAAQKFQLTDKVPYAPAKQFDFDQAMQHALARRPDYLAAEARLRAATLNKRAAQAEAYPTLVASGDYGLLGTRYSNSRSTYNVGAGVNIPIFQGGKVKADVDFAEAVRKQREAEMLELRSGIEFDVRNALLDISSAAQRVEVARQSIQLADQALTQSQDRFASGVTGSLEVVQAQEAVAAANENFISALYEHNVAKLTLARALGVAEAETKRFLEGK